MGSYQSGQMGLTVTQLSFDFGGSNPFQAEGRGFESRLPLFFLIRCCRSSGVEHFLGKEEVAGSSPIDSSIKLL